MFAALIHDAGHTGVSNNALAKEEPTLAAHYNNKAIAEQKSLDLAWNELLQPQYDEIRRHLFVSPSDVQHFRQLVVNLGLATDIFDPELSKFRTNRWSEAFGNHTGTQADEDRPMSKFCSDRRATIVIEHLIQASDVSHCMQHFVVFKKWNQRLFREMYTAYASGRSDKDPSINWYENELAFFDLYVIPLAQKLEQCGVFGVSSDEYISYARCNRDEWEDRGRAIVSDMLEEVKSNNASIKE